MTFLQCKCVIADSNQMKLQGVKISNLSHYVFYIHESATRKIHQKISFQHASRIFIPISCILHQVLTHFWSKRLRSLHSCWCWHRGLWWLQLDHISHNNPRWLKATSLSQLEQASHTGPWLGSTSPQTNKCNNRLNFCEDRETIVGWT